jgi:hypothetical protein
MNLCRTSIVAALAVLLLYSHTPVFGADGRLWELGCGCAV